MGVYDGGAFVPAEAGSAAGIQGRGPAIAEETQDGLDRRPAVCVGAHAVRAEALVR